MKRTRNLIRRALATTAGLVTVAGAFVGVTAAPAHAALRSGPGYAWLTVAGGGATTSYNSTGLPVDVSKSLDGSTWGVTFEGQSDLSGVPTVSTGAAVPGAQCDIESSSLTSNVPGRLDREVHVHCGHQNSWVGAPFTLSWSSVPAASEGWVYTDSTQGGANTSRYSTGGWVSAPRVFPGVYATSFGGIGGPGGVTVGSVVGFLPYHCNVVAQSAAPDGSESVPVVCRDWNQQPVDTIFTEHYVRGHGLFGDAALLQGYATVAGSAPAPWTTVTGANAYSSTGKAVHSWHPFTGVYQVKFDGLAGTKRVVHVNTVTNSPTGGPCAVDAAAAGADGTATVVCRNVNDKPVDETFQVTYSATP